MAILIAKSVGNKGQLSHFVDSICHDSHRHDTGDTKHRHCFVKTSAYKAQNNSIVLDQLAFELKQLKRETLNDILTLTILTTWIFYGLVRKNFFPSYSANFS